MIIGTRGGEAMPAPDVTRRPTSVIQQSQLGEIGTIVFGLGASDPGAALLGAVRVALADQKGVAATTSEEQPQ